MRVAIPFLTLALVPVSPLFAANETSETALLGFLPLLLFITILWFFFSRRNKNKSSTGAPMGIAPYYCNSCKNTTTAALMRGNGWIEFLLYFLWIIPGIFYSIWRRQNPPNVCPICKAEALVPASMAKMEPSRQPARAERDCPHCAERILVHAKVCKHCGGQVV